MSVVWERTRPESCLSDLALDAGASTDEAVAHLRGCADCRARLAAIDAMRNEALPPLPRPLPIRRRIYGTIGLALAAAIALFVAFIPKTELTRTKGSASLGFYVRHGANVRRGADREIVAPEDALRFVYSADRATYLSILALDAAGKVSVYHPAGAQHPAAPGRDVPLESAALLDATLGKETIYGFFCEAPLDLAKISVELEQHRKPNLEDCTVVELTIDKRAP